MSTAPHDAGSRRSAGSPYHEGELVAQQLAGEVERADRSGRAVRALLPPVAAAFLAEQPLLVVGGTDDAGAVWASMLTGHPRFLRAVDEQTLDVHASPGADDPLAAVLRRPAVVGSIAIEPASRRRVRLNGTSTPLDGGLRLSLDQVVSNCPKYIQARGYRRADAEPPGPARRGRSLDDAQIAAVRRADTFFVATRHPGGDTDASHRGGAPGFVEVLDGNHLRWPDYAGNSMYLTFGNLQVDPRAGLLVPNWSTGTLLHLSGVARVDWDAERAATVPGASRLVDFTVEAVVERPAASPLRWSRPEYSRFNPPVGVAATT
ncbi:pyridoxamine 5'-phosphate oxidase family protein [Cryptosporangium minutisporangium]|uniref:Pyridoxamine 5'-phosphate oxidase family protein n=1 Tax=Cryptosporangium minutisporangium TaxID=113569 RepID=A0ABP6SRY4_9ACTN